MTQKNNILIVVACIYAALVLSACVVGKKKTTNTGGVSEQYCRDQHKDYDRSLEACKAPDKAFCAINLGMVMGFSACRKPSSQADCDSLGSTLSKTFTWQNNTCEESRSTVGQGKLDTSIRIAWTGKRTVQGAKTAFVDIGSATITISKNDQHQVNILKKANSTCSLRRTFAGGKRFKVQAKGPASTCFGQILVINRKTGDYNVKEFSVTLN